MRIKLVWVTLGWLCAALSHLQAAPPSTLPTALVVPGGVAVVQLNRVHEAKPQVTFATKQVMLVAHNKHWFAIVGIPLDVTPGEYNLLAKYSDAVTEYPLRVAAKKYPVQHLTVRNKNHVEPDPATLARIEAERAQLTAAFARWSARETLELSFTLPTRGRISSHFGLRRFFNGQARQPHSGLDLAAPLGTRVQAPAGGQVIATGDFFFNGNTVLLDHGQGLVTMYCHLSKIEVMPGQALARGDKLGEVGASGRATGPHLHWTVSLNKSAVDPNLFLAPGERARGKP